uniref:Uncharacterized protein n=1 Tax=Arundo donax TaxID=35708 RepID=A0A0A9BAI6_ARUDO
MANEGSTVARKYFGQVLHIIISWANIKTN